MICHRLNLIIFVLELVNFSGTVSEKICALNELFVCQDGETCEQIKNSTTGVCRCKNNYTRISPNSGCVRQVDPNHPLPEPAGVYSQGPSISEIIGVFLIIVLLIVLTAVLVIAARKYRWVHRVREKVQRYRERHYDTVLVNQEDDPPLA